MKTDPYLPYGGPPPLRPDDWRKNLLDHIAACTARRHANSDDPKFWATLSEEDRQRWRVSVQAGLGILRAAVMDDATLPTSAKGVAVRWLSQHG
jgi:hypothetical protein